MQFVDPSLPRHLDSWTSQALGLEMPIARYGERGHGVLLFPTAAADCLENERFFLIKAIEDHIFAGRLQVFSIDSINKHAWMNEDLPVQEKARRQRLYAEYVEGEVVPYMRRQMGNEKARFATCGASFGAFHAANQFFRRPDLFDTVIAMSGFYDLAPSYTFGFVNEDVYFNNPVAYLSNLDDGDQLNRLKTDCDIHIITGRGRWEAPHRSEQLAEVLARKGIPHNLDMWGPDVDHDWPWWRRMIDHYVAHRLRFIPSASPPAAAQG